MLWCYGKLVTKTSAAAAKFIARVTNNIAMMFCKNTDAFAVVTVATVAMAVSSRVSQMLRLQTAWSSDSSFPRYGGA